MTRSSTAICLALAAVSCHTPDAAPSPIVARVSAGQPAAPAPAPAPAPAVSAAPRGSGKLINQLHVVDDARFWVVAGGRAFETHDGGRTFGDRTPFARATGEGAESREVWSLLASPSRVLVLRGDDDQAPWMSLFVSEDGGASFVERRVPRLRGGRGAWLQPGPTPASLLVLRSDGGGMNSHATSILETRDAGRTFHALGTVTGYGGVSFQDRSRWWSVGSCCASSSSLYRSIDAGRTWTLAAEPSNMWEPLSDPVFLDASRGYRVARAGEGGKLVIERTDDAGRTFAPAEPPLEATDVLLADRDACVLLGDAGGPVVTRDRGATWASLAPLPAGLSSPRLARTPHGWLALASAGEQSALLALRDGTGAWEELAPSWVEP